jgi:hypothetical protein
MRPRTAGIPLGVVTALALAASAAPAAQTQRPPLHVAAPSRAQGGTVAPTFARRFVGSAKHSRRVQASTAWSHQS